MSNPHSIDTNLSTICELQVPFWVTNGGWKVSRTREKEKLNDVSALLHHVSKLHEFFRSQNVCCCFKLRNYLSYELVKSNSYTQFSAERSDEPLQPCNCFVVQWPTFLVLIWIIYTRVNNISNLNVQIKITVKIPPIILYVDHITSKTRDRWEICY